MGMSAYMRDLRAIVGTQLLVMPSVTGIVFDEANRILLVRQRDVDLWSTPGGAVDPNEAPADAVVREMWEETGLYVAPTRIIGVYGGREVTYPNGDRCAYITTVFECDARGGALRASSEETIDAAFVGADDLPRYQTTAWVKYALPAMYDRTRHAYFEPPKWVPAGL